MVGLISNDKRERNPRKGSVSCWMLCSFLEFFSLCLVGEMRRPPVCLSRISNHRTRIRRRKRERGWCWCRNQSRMKNTGDRDILLGRIGDRSLHIHIYICCCCFLSVPEKIEISYSLSSFLSPKEGRKNMCHPLIKSICIVCHLRTKKHFPVRDRKANNTNGKRDDMMPAINRWSSGTHKE